MVLKPAALCATSVAALALAACGADKSSGPSKTLDDVSAALGKATSIHIEGTQTDDEGTARINGDITPSALRLRVRQAGGQTLVVLTIAKQTYLKANTAYWTKNADAKVAKVLANRWVKAPASQARELEREAERLLPRGLAHCVNNGTGTLSSSTSTLDGAPVTVIHDKGDKPGTEPGDLFVAARGEPLPLRVTQTGPRKAGGKQDARCDDDESTQRAQDLRFSYDRRVKLEAPPDAIDLDALHSGGSGQAA